MNAKPSNADIDAKIRDRLASTDWAAELFARGQAVVALDEDGNLRQYLPDGTSVPYQAPSTS